MSLRTSDQGFDQMISKLGPITPEQVAARAKEVAQEKFKKEQKAKERRKKDEADLLLFSLLTSTPNCH
jgi:hypothetical protein